MFRSLLLQLAGLTVLGSAVAQNRSLIVSDEAVKVSEHVWAILGYPNIAIVVGTRGTLVVDTGLGPRNAATVARVADSLAPNTKLYLTTTHFHPEHASGDGGFPSGTTLIRNRVQQTEMKAHGQEMIEMFAHRSAEEQALLASAVPREPDVLFDSEYKLDLGGGVHVRLLWFGGAHTKGDELTFVEPDKTLISGDVVQNNVVPNIYGEGGTPSTWLAVLAKVQSLGARHVLPDHSAPGSGALVAEERALIVELRMRALNLKRQGVSVDEAGQRLTDEYKTRFAESIKSVAGFVSRIYAE
jgi:glyoxylase-like metal-dependent hydrolase (beta-lactamase superfamily II)